MHNNEVLYVITVVMCYDHVIVAYSTEGTYTQPASQLVSIFGESLGVDYPAKSPPR